MSKLQAAIARDAAKYQEACTAVNKFVVAANDKYDGYAYSTGYLGSALVQMATTYLTKAQFAEFLQSMEEAAASQQTA